MKKIKLNYIETFKLILIAGLYLYALFAVIDWDLYPGNWTESLREAYSIVMLIVSIIALWHFNSKKDTELTLKVNKHD